MDFRVAVAHEKIVSSAGSNALLNFKYVICGMLWREIKFCTFFTFVKFG